MRTERAILVTIQFDPRFTPVGARWSMDDEAQELRELAGSSGCQVAAEVRARRHQPIAGTFLGTGKLEEIAETVRAHRGQVVVFSQELSATQQRNIEERLGAKTIDRTQLILDIFAQRAKSQEGKVQVELAQLRYLLPRLTGKGVMLSRLGGGIGTRGPGEQKLEMDRRRIRARLAHLEDDLERLGRRREATRSRRKEGDVPVVALVGYTNAGKTTLLNRLAGAGSLARDQLFTTLDPLARRITLPDGEVLVLTDTVGFLHHLPHHLIESFKATLEEARDADLLLHVVDVSHPLVSEHTQAVEEVLTALGLQEKPRLTALNKVDLVDGAPPAGLFAHPAASCAISAKTGEGMDALCRLISDQLNALLIAPVRLRIPHERPDLIALVYQKGHVLQRVELDGAVELLARLSATPKSACEDYRIPT